MRKHQELLERLDEENAARSRLTLELHQAQGEHRLWAGLAAGAHRPEARGVNRGEVLTEVLKAKCKTKTMHGVRPQRLSSVTQITGAITLLPRLTTSALPRVVR